MKVTCPHCGEQIEINPAEILGKRGGQSTSEAKARAARENGKKHRQHAKEGGDAT